MKIKVEKEIDTTRLSKKINRALLNYPEVGCTVVDKKVLCDVLSVLKYIDGEFQEVKSETIKEVEKLKNVTEQLKALEESRIEQNRSVIEKTTKNCTHISHLTELPYCFGNFDAKEVNCIFCGSRSGCEKYKGEKSVQETLCDSCIWKDTESCKCDCSRERMTAADVKVIHDCFVNFTIGESWERECDKCDFKLPCVCMSMKKCMEGKCNG